MQTSSLQFCLSTGLAIGFGAAVATAVSSGTAEGYPAGPAVSLGSNPIVSTGGRIDADPGSAVVLSSSTSGQDLVITDVVLTGTSTGTCRGQIGVELKRSDTAETVARFTVDVRTHDYASTGLVDSHFISGIPLPSGVDLQMDAQMDYRNCGGDGIYFLDYTLSGYLAQA